MPLALAYLEHPAVGAETAPPLLIAHGLFGSARNFNAIGKRLADRRRVVLVDMRNHGSSPWADEMGYPAMAGDLAAVIDRHCGGRAVVLGHSMGGKAAMALALTAPEKLAGLIVADIAPVAYSHSHRSFVAAMQGVDLARITRRSQVDPLLAGTIPEAPLRAFILQNLVVDAEGARWRLNLAALDAEMACLIGFPEKLGGPFSGPALFLYGTASDYVTETSRPAIDALFPAADFEGVDGAGHWLHAEQPEAFLAAVAAWLANRVD
ncbi:MAG: alpha/beta fold hydrolase [Pikeienuella sp.]